eukprot:TRINITY_DN3701_c0_g1_i1.p1 TRINITY_DN3701_c0_g1~~TRINITY_DN3701_c0_g1_i1.p1  ORF type:complete len:156 (+),score=21.95 TRINITY_DN3701_c0_g1_i1:139-606(+)
MEGKPVKVIRVHNQAMKKIWSDEGTGCKPHDGSFWRPLAPQGFYILGDLGEANHRESPNPLFPAVAVTASKIEDEAKLFAPPLGYQQIWEGKTMKKQSNFGPVSFWHPIPPEGYVALGSVGERLLPSHYLEFKVHPSEFGATRLGLPAREWIYLV